MKLNLGCGSKKLSGYINIDQSEHFEPDLMLDLENTPYPFKTSSIDEIIMNSVLEHLPGQPKEFFRILKEIYRIMKDQAELKIFCPPHSIDGKLSTSLTKNQLIERGWKCLTRDFAKNSLSEAMQRHRWPCSTI
jgi:predicted SAM-dependent methyltransferase